MTKAQKRELHLLHDCGYIVHQMSWRGMPRNKALWNLVEKGLAYFDFGPNNSWLKQQGFMPTWQDPVC